MILCKILNARVVMHADAERPVTNRNGFFAYADTDSTLNAKCASIVPVFGVAYAECT